MAMIMSIGGPLNPEMRLNIMAAEALAPCIAQVINGPDIDYVE